MRVRTGLEVAAGDGFAALRGRKVGLITNPTGVLPDRTTNIAALRAAGVSLKALFGPEHGVRGDVPAGKWVASGRDPQTGLPVFSLYGPTRTPTTAMLRGIDTLVFDLQDIGCRSYTYLSTLGAALNAAARHGIGFVVLDRPNPLGGVRVEGAPVRPGFASFVGKYPCAYRHGLTPGEAARWLVGSGNVGKAALTVIPCAGLAPTMARWDDFGGLPWVRTSPNIPSPQTPHLYAATGIVGELTSLSIGIGTDAPFARAGRPDLRADALLDALTNEALPGFSFAADVWTPSRGVFAGKRCHGVRIVVDDPAAPLTRLNVALLCALRRCGVGGLFAPGEPTRMFDLSCGTDRVRKAFVRGADGEALWHLFDDGAAAFDRARQPFRLYPSWQ